MAGRKTAGGPSLKMPSVRLRLVFGLVIGVVLLAGCRPNLDDVGGRESEWTEIAQLDLTSGKLIVGDVQFVPNLDDSLLVDLPSGTYSVQRKLVTYGQDTRVAALRVILLDATGDREGQIGSTWTDTATMGVSDYSAATGALSALGQDEFHDRVLSAVHQATGEPVGVVTWVRDHAEMPFAASGFGDGLYPVYELVTDGDRVGVEVEFIAQGTPYPFTARAAEDASSRVVEAREAPALEPWTGTE
jgi:hypothetical protein